MKGLAQAGQLLSSEQLYSITAQLWEEIPSPAPPQNIQMPTSGSDSMTTLNPAPANIESETTSLHHRSTEAS